MTIQLFTINEKNFLTKFQLQVTASDGDKDRPEKIVYFLTGQGIDPDRPDQSKFDINKTSGEIYVLKVRKITTCLISFIHIVL